MDNHIKKLVRELPNDQELGKAIRKYINNQRACCDDINNRGTYIDGAGVVFDQCKVCCKILT